MITTTKHWLPFLAALTLSSAAHADLTLVENGTPRAILVLPTKPTYDEARAARELQIFIARISDANLEVANQGAPLNGLTPILIGRAAPDSVIANLKTKTQDSTAFSLQVGNGQIAFRGLDTPDDPPLQTDYPTFIKAIDAQYYGTKPMRLRPTMAKGTRNAAYELLEQCGIRWYFPGPLGTVIPRQKTIVLKDQSTVQIPSFPARHMSGTKSDDWKERMRHGGQLFPSSHGIPGFAHEGIDPIFKEHPEYFAFINGERRPRQLCVSNPEVVKLAIENIKTYFRTHPNDEMIGIGPKDGRGFCECPNCKALDGGDFDPFGHYESMTDRYIWFFNQILDGIKDEFPTKRVGFYAYSVYCRPPVKVKPNPRIVPAVALITLCRIHGVGNPNCPEKSYQKAIVRGWGKLLPEVFDRGYWFNLADPGNPFFMIRRVQDEIPIGKALGIAGWRVESAYNWTGEAPSLYLASKLMWDLNTDVPALLTDFYSKFFGPAAAPMRAYIEGMDNAVYEANYHTGSSWDAPHIYSPAIRQKARAALTEAARLAPAGTPYAERIAVYTRHFDHLETFLEVLDTRAAQNYEASMAALNKLAEIRADLNKYSPPLISELAESYMRRFFTAATKQGYERVTNGNELVAALPNKWLFMVDPEEVGEAINLFSPEITGGEWRTVEPYTTSWGDLGLRSYNGDAWYRQTIDVPAKFKDKRIFLWFGGVDEAAKVWVNGRLIGEGKGAFAPFELDATSAIRAGQPNLIVVKATNEVLNEVGCGGIVAPVMLYAPAAGKDAIPQGGIAPAIQDVETIMQGT